MNSYKDLKDSAKEMKKDFQVTKKWVAKITEKLKQFSKRDIFKEYDEVTEQVKALDKEIKIISGHLIYTLEEVLDDRKSITNLYKEVLENRKTITNLYRDINFILKQIEGLKKR